MSASISLVFDWSIIRKTFKWIGQSNNSFHSCLGFNTGRLIADWSVQYMWRDVIQDVVKMLVYREKIIKITIKQKNKTEQMSTFN